jgi:hypothetical protein
MSLGFPDDGEEAVEFVGVGHAEAQPDDSPQQPIANVVHVHVEQDQRALLVVAVLVVLALLLRH